MTIQPFTRNYEDHSSETGFQFTFFCDICNNGFKTSFTESKTHKKQGLFRGVGRALSFASSMTGSDIGYRLAGGADSLSDRFSGMTADWHKEHEQAFGLAMNEAKQRFKRCPKCQRWVCDLCWNEQEGLCVEDAPRASVEIAAARSEKMVQDIKEAAAGTQVFTGKIERQQTICPRCGKPAGEGKFCVNCGAPLQLLRCPKCGAKNPIGQRFCGECGTRLE
jgi:hypothetical protein